MYVRLSGRLCESIVDGPGLGYVLFAQGCPHKCGGCHNQHTHNFSGGFDMSIKDILNEMDENPFLSGITLSGGEPFCQPEPMLTLAEMVKSRGKSVVAYSGWTFEELMEMSNEDDNIKKLMYTVDILIDGRYEESKKDLKLPFRGSSNQVIVDMAKSMCSGTKLSYSLT